MATDLFGRPIRLCYFEAILFTDGRANTSDLIDEFGVSRQQASADINEYFKIAGPVAVYCATRKAYILDKRRKPKLMTKESFPVFLASLRALQGLTAKASRKSSAQA